MKVLLGNGKEIDKDIELCWTTSERISDAAMKLLIHAQIPFTKKWLHIPFFLREKFHGAKQVYVISINRNRYSQARRVIDQLEPDYRRKLRLSNF